MHTVQEVARLAGISVRALHYYDEIGLLKPLRLETNGYRQYAQEDLIRLQQVLVLRELGFALEEIKKIVAGCAQAQREALIEHRSALLARRRRIDRMLDSLDHTIRALEAGTQMDERKMLEPFNDEAQAGYRKEAEQRWGKEVVAESYRRLNRLSQQERQAMFAQGGEIERDAAALVGMDPGDAAVQAVIGRWFAYLNRSFYHMTPAIFRGLGEMYVQDPRFAEHYNTLKPGLAQLMRDGMNAYCDALEAEGKQVR